LRTQSGLVRPGLRPISLAAHCCGVTPPHSPRGGLGTKFARYFTYRAGILHLKFFSFADSKSHMDRNKFYVTVSRAKSDVTILTDDVDKLQKNAQEWCHKVTSDDFIHNLEDEIDENQTKIVGSDYKDKFQRAVDLQHLAELSPAVIAERNQIREKYGEVTWDKLPSFSSAFDSLRFDSSTQDKTIRKKTAISTPLPKPNQPINVAPVSASIPQSHSAETLSAQPPIKPKKVKKIEKSHNTGFSR